MLAYILKRILFTMPIMLGVALVCFMLVHLAPGDPLGSVLPPDASETIRQQLMVLYQKREAALPPPPSGRQPATVAARQSRQTPNVLQMRLAMAQG